MLGSKHINKIIIGIVLLGVVLAGLFLYVAVKSSGGESTLIEYEDKMFDKESITQIEILMDEEDWAQMLENAMAEEYYRADIVINGETF